MAILRQTEGEVVPTTRILQAEGNHTTVPPGAGGFLTLKFTNGTDKEQVIRMYNKIFPGGRADR